MNEKKKERTKESIHATFIAKIFILDKTDVVVNLNTTVYAVGFFVGNIVYRVFYRKIFPQGISTEKIKENKNA